MRAAVLTAPGRLAVQEVPDPLPAPGEALVAVSLAGICGSDVHLYDGSRPANYPLILGHEAVGRIVSPGPSGLPVGARVAIEPNIPCGSCETCQQDLGTVCPHKRSLGVNAPGVFAELVAVPAEFLWPIPEDLHERDAVGLEPLAVAVHAARVGRVSAGERAVVIGCGNEGLLLVQVLTQQGARVLAVDRRAGRLRQAREAGAAGVLEIDATAPPDVAAARIATEWAPTVLFECAGAASAVELAIAAAAPGGRIVLVGLADQPARLIPLTFVRRGLSLLSSLIYDHPADFTAALELLRGSRVRPGLLGTETYPLEAAAAAFDHVVHVADSKVLLTIDAVARKASASPRLEHTPGG